MLLTTITLNNPGRGLVHDAQAVHRTLKYLDPNVLWGCPDGLHLIVQHSHSIDWTTGMGRAMRMAHNTSAYVDWPRRLVHPIRRYDPARAGVPQDYGCACRPGGA